MTLITATENPTLAILGCGKLGQALLVGLLRSAGSHPGSFKIRELTVTVRSARTAQLVQQRITPLLKGHGRALPPVRILLQDQNRMVVEQADIVVLGCKHSSLGELLHDLQDMRHDSRRVLISMMGGVSSNLLMEAYPLWTGPIVHAVCSIAAAVGESITLLSTSDDRKVEEESQRMVTNLFAAVGSVQWLPECQMHVASAVGSSSLAFFAKIIEGLAQGAVQFDENRDHPNDQAQRLPWETALAIAAQAARGTATLLQQNPFPAHLVAEVATKGGATAAGLAVLETENVVQALRTCAAVTADATAGLAPPLIAHGDSVAVDEVSRANSSSE